MNEKMYFCFVISFKSIFYEYSFHFYSNKNVDVKISRCANETTINRSASNEGGVNTYRQPYALNN